MTIPKPFVVLAGGRNSLLPQNNVDSPQTVRCSLSSLISPPSWQHQCIAMLPNMKVLACTFLAVMLILNVADAEQIEGGFQ